MKRINNLYMVFLPVISLILFLGFSSHPTNNLRAADFSMPDSSNQNNNSYMMGHRMMNGRMMGRGMMGQTGLKNVIKDKNGNWVVPASANKLKDPLRNIEEASIKGKKLFNAQCFTCHGTGGKGNGPAAVSLNPKPANLISHRVQKQSDGAIYWKITNGYSPMPSFKYALTENQRWELVNYIRTLAKQQ